MKTLTTRASKGHWLWKTRTSWWKPWPPGLLKDTDYENHYHRESNNYMDSNNPKRETYSNSICFKRIFAQIQSTWSEKQYTNKHISNTIQHTRLSHITVEAYQCSRVCSMEWPVGVKCICYSSSVNVSLLHISHGICQDHLIISQNTFICLTKERQCEEGHEPKHFNPKSSPVQATKSPPEKLTYRIMWV